MQSNKSFQIRFVRKEFLHIRKVKLKIWRLCENWFLFGFYLVWCCLLQFALLLSSWHHPHQFHCWVVTSSRSLLKQSRFNARAFQYLKLNSLASLFTPSIHHSYGLSLFLLLSNHIINTFLSISYFVISIRYPAYLSLVDLIHFKMSMSLRNNFILK